MRSNPRVTRVAFVLLALRQNGKKSSASTFHVAWGTWIAPGMKALQQPSYLRIVNRLKVAVKACWLQGLAGSGVLQAKHRGSIILNTIRFTPQARSLALSPEP